ncbi:hypothetical protein Tco_0190392 [Tanacetum coccineum]
MSNTNNNMQTQTSSALHNAIMEAGGKNRPPMLSPSNYIQWKSRIKRYIDTKLNHELIHFCLKNPPYIYKFLTTDANSTPVTPGNEGTSQQQQQQRGEVMETFATVPEDIQKWITAEAKAVQIILTRIDNDIYSTFDAYPNTIEILLHRKFILQLKPEWQRFVTIVKQSQDLKNVSYYKIYDILKQHKNEVNEIRAERLACTANPLALIAQQQLVYHPQTHPTHYTQKSEVVADDESSSKEKEIDKVMALTLIYFKKIYKPTNNNLKTLSNTRNTNVDNTPRTNRGTGECQKPKQARDLTYYQENMLLCKQEEAGIQLSAEQVDRRNDTDDEPEDQELEVHYMYMAKIQEVTPDSANNSRPIFDVEALKKSVETMIMLNQNCKTSFVKPKYLKKAQSANPRLYDIGCYNDNIALTLAPESDEMIRLAQESRSKLSDLIKPFDYKNLNNFYDLFVPQREKSAEQKEYYYADHMNAILGVYTKLNEVTNLQCDYLEALEKCQSLENDLLKRNTTSTSFEALQQHAINLELALHQCQEQIKNDKAWKQKESSSTKKPIAVPISTREPKRTVNQSAATPHKKTVASDSTIQKPRSTFRNLYEHVSKTCSWWYPKINPPGYKWKPKSKIGNIIPNVSVPLGAESRTTNILVPKTDRRTNLSNTPLSSNSFAAHRNNHVHSRLWVLIAHDRKSQASC